MNTITFSDIETEIRKIPIEKLSEVYSIIRSYSENPDKRNISDPVKKNLNLTIKKLKGYIDIQDLKDYPQLKERKKPIVTNYASTVDEDILMFCVHEPDGNER